ncbi:unnamed protein product [Euphydryas editha]|uniref:C2H2-type domain-containing protein n=1 Tax=Euphydryas editha TaxID=104508 RepID=A0AAU9TZ51_EUPED|nr:unnamed protein product [Euphydryas editha]
MDKNTYETYEYLPINNADNDASQFFVVQEDGTFLSIDKPVQFVTQVQDVKQTLDESQPCSVYDVTPQQFYVDVNNSSELISVPDQFVIPEGENNMYTNSYLLQAVENEKEEQMEQDNVSQNKEITVSSESAVNEENINIENAENKNEDCTEITLSDEQYQLLEKNGWILLEISERIFLLDTLGLRDITDDEKLIEKLKREIEDDNSEETHVSLTKVENKDETYEKSKINSKKLQNSNQNTNDTVNFVIQDEDVIEDNENSQDTSSYYENEEDMCKSEVIFEEELNENGHLTSTQSPHDYVKLTSVKGTSVKRENNALRIKTCFSFKDIPPQIVLGKTIHGKKLVASVRTEKTNNLGKNSKQTNSLKAGSGQCNTGLDEAKFKNVIQEAIWGTGEKCTMKDVTAAEIVVEQLLRMVIQEYEQSGNKMYAESIPTLVTGQVIRNGPKMNFLYIPDMLQLSVEDEENDDMNQRNKDADDDHYLHIHIRELKGIDGITRISITLNKRHIPLKDVNDGNNMRQKLIYACSACAAVYKTEEGLRLHQETECMEIDDMLTIDAENTDTEYAIVGVGKEKQYICNLCNKLTSLLNWFLF